MRIKFILLTSRDPWLPPKGGTSAFARQLLEVFQDEVAVVSMADGFNHIDRWIDRVYKSKAIKYLCVAKYTKTSKIVPSRIIYMFNLYRNRRRIKELGINRVFIDSPEAIWAMPLEWGSSCYMFHGLNNPVANSKFLFLRVLGKTFERFFFLRLTKIKPDCFLAAADQRSIRDFNDSTKFNIKVGEINSFPTRVDNKIFYPVDESKILRKKLGINSEIVFTSVGRLARIKGWDLILEAFALFHTIYPSSTFVFVGDGEDHHKITQQTVRLKLQGSVIITGMLEPSDVANYINISDLCLVGSYREGWSVAMCEILACGKAIVSTSVSGASDMIIEGGNGFIVNQRNPKEFCDKMMSALELKNSQKVSLELSKKFQLSNLKNDLESIWSPIREN